MDDLNEVLDTSRRSRLFADITLLMIKGAGYAMVALLVIWLVIAVIAGIGRALPDEAQMADDPSPWPALEYTN